MKINIKYIMILVALVALSIVSLISSSFYWDIGLFSVNFFLLCMTFSLSLVSKTNKRNFYVGFTVFGLSYSLISSIKTTEFRLITTEVLAFADGLRPTPKAHQISVSLATIRSGGAGGTAFSSYYDSWARTSHPLPGSSTNFMRIGHTLFAIIFGLIGGVFAQKVHPE